MSYAAGCWRSQKSASRSIAELMVGSGRKAESVNHPDRNWLVRVMGIEENDSSGLSKRYGDKKGGIGVVHPRKES